MTSDTKYELFKSKFQRAEVQDFYHRNVFNIYTLLSELGGLISITFRFLGLLGYIINSKFLQSKLIRALYYVQTK